MVLNKIGVTGATGMLGRHIRATLEGDGSQVVAVSREKDTTQKVASWNLKDWQSLKDLDRIFEGVQVVIHAGAMLPNETEAYDEGAAFNVNVRSSLNLGLWAIERQVPLVYVSGAIVYKDQEKMYSDENEELGWNELGCYYGFSKLLAENTLTTLRSNGLKLAVIRPSSIYGFGLPENKMVSSFLNRAKADEIIPLRPPVDDRIDFVHAADVSLAILSILKMDAWDTFNISSGNLLSAQELAEACVSVSGHGSIDIIKENPPERASVNRFALNTQRAKTDIGWQPSFSIEQGLKMMLGEKMSPDFGDANKNL
jgi:UDP-glucose 4-epimerase